MWISVPDIVTKCIIHSVNVCEIVRGNRAIEMCIIHLLEEIHADYNHAIINGKTADMVNSIVRACRDRI